MCKNSALQTVFLKCLQASKKYFFLERLIIARERACLPPARPILSFCSFVSLPCLSCLSTSSILFACLSFVFSTRGKKKFRCPSSHSETTGRAGAALATITEAEALLHGMDLDLFGCFLHADEKISRFHSRCQAGGIVFKKQLRGYRYRDLSISYIRYILYLHFLYIQ